MECRNGIRTETSSGYVLSLISLCIRKKTAAAKKRHNRLIVERKREKEREGVKKIQDAHSKRCSAQCVFSDFGCSTTSAKLNRYQQFNSILNRLHKTDARTETERCLLSLFTLTNEGQEKKLERNLCC